MAGMKHNAHLFSMLYKRWEGSSTDVCCLWGYLYYLFYENTIVIMCALEQGARLVVLPRWALCVPYSPMLMVHSLVETWTQVSRWGVAVFISSAGPFIPRDTFASYRLQWVLHLIFSHETTYCGGWEHIHKVRLGPAFASWLWISESSVLCGWLALSGLLI